MSKNNDLIHQLVSVLHEMVNDYAFNRCEEKRMETIGEAKRLLGIANKIGIIEPNLDSIIVDLKAALNLSAGVLLMMREQIEQMRPMFDDEDGAIQSTCDSHDELLSTFVDLGGIA
jgi:hypothetical protein